MNTHTTATFKLSGLLTVILSLAACGVSETTPNGQISPTATPVVTATPNSTPIITPSPIASPMATPTPSATPSTLPTQAPASLFAPHNLVGKDITLKQTDRLEETSSESVAVRTFSTAHQVFTRALSGSIDSSLASYSINVIGDVITETAIISQINDELISSTERETIYTFTNDNMGNWQQSIGNEAVSSGTFTMRETPFLTDGNGDFSWQITENENNRTVEVHLPANFDAKEQSPLVIAFHGDNVNGNFIRNMTDFNAISDEYRPVIMYPNGSLVEYMGRSVRTWEASPFPEGMEVTFRDKAFVNKIIDSAIIEYNIDPERIYITGHSRGSLFVNRLLCEMPERFAAAAITSGNLDEGLVESCSTTAVPLIHSHNTEDPNLPLAGLPANEQHSFPGLRSIDDSLAFYAEKNGCAPEPVISVLPDINTDDKSTVNLYEYQGCDETTPLVHYRVDIASHSWPGSSFHHSNGLINQDINWTEIQWQFFAQF